MTLGPHASSASSLVASWCVLWAGLEPTRGHYNSTYLDELENIVDLAAEHGVYVMFNGHQDGISELFCGARRWVFHLPFLLPTNR